MTQSNHRPHSNHGRADRAVTSPDVLELAERTAIAAAVTRANSQPHDASIAEAVAWARSVRLHALLLDSVLAGDVDILVSSEGRDLTFREHEATNLIPFGPASRAVRPRRSSV